LATIVHTNGSIPSYESSRMLVREDGSIEGTIGGGCVEADVWAAAKEVMQVEAFRKMTFSLNNDANYDSGLICGGTIEIFVEPILPQHIMMGEVTDRMDRTLGAPRENHRVIVLQHAESENLGTIEDALNTGGVTFDYVRAFEGQPIPDAVGESSGLIVMGGPMSVYETDRFPFLGQEMKLIEAFLEAQRPILGVCLGSQMLAAALGATVRKGRKKEIGWFPVELSPASGQDPLWSGQPSRFEAYHWHGDIFDPPKEAVPLASSDITPVQSFRFGDRAYGILFHLEVTERHIQKMLNEFASEIQEENLKPEEILNQAESLLPALQTISSTIFRRWTQLLYPSRGSQSGRTASRNCDLDGN
jgi:GMP synthase (glutamine-hydrolysing)